MRQQRQSRGAAVADVNLTESSNPEPVTGYHSGFTSDSSAYKVFLRSVFVTASAQYENGAQLGNWQADSRLTHAPSTA